MNNRGMQISIVVVLAGLLLIGLAGCGKDDAEADPNATTKAVGGTSTTSAVTQTTCPIMGGKIDKSVSADYQGKKVYFCCGGCIKKFEAEPDKYTKDLPQFKN